MNSSLRQTGTLQHRALPRVNNRPHPKTPSSGQHPRRRFLHLVVGTAALPATRRLAWAQSYPTRPITMIVPFAPGGTTDATARILAERMRATLGQAIVIENVGGADGNIGVGRAARAAPDGYVINIGILSTHVLNAAFYSLQYDVVNDFVPITPLVASPSILFARRTMPGANLNELIAWLKANPNKASMGFGASGPHLLSVLLQKETGTFFTLVPYRGGGPATQDLVAGQIDLQFANPDMLPLVRAGSIKAYAVTKDERLAVAPDIPTFAEWGLPALSYSQWTGFFVPKGTPKEIIIKLNAAAVEALADPAVQSRLAVLGLEIFPRYRQTPEALTAMQKADAEKWWPIIKEFGIKAE